MGNFKNISRSELKFYYKFLPRQTDRGFKLNKSMYQIKKRPNKVYLFVDDIPIYILFK